jgi:hypothetical protein
MPRVRLPGIPTPEFAAVHESIVGPSLHLLRRKQMSAIGELRTFRRHRQTDLLDP